MQGLLSNLKQAQDALRVTLKEDYERLPAPLRRGWEGLLTTLKFAYWPGAAEKRDSPAAKTAERDEPLPPKPEKRDDQAEAAAYGAAVAHVINRPDGIRARAQVSATISAAVAAALAAFAPLTGLASHEWWPQLLVALAILGWLVSLWRYILVISFSYHAHEQEISSSTEETTDPTEFHLKKFLTYAGLIRTAVDRGTAATKMALGFTLAAAVALATEPLLASPLKSLVVSLNDDGFDAVNQVCPNAVKRHVDATARPGDLTRDVVPLRLAAETCMEDENVVVHVRRGWIDAVRQN